MSGSDLCIPRNETAWPSYFQNRMSASQFPHSCICERFIYSQDLSAYFAAQMQTDPHECRNLAVQFQFWKYINRIFGTVCLCCLADDDEVWSANKMEGRESRASDKTKREERQVVVLLVLAGEGW
jgi:hypothetical protein